MTIDVHEAARNFGQELQDLLDKVLPTPTQAKDDDRLVRVTGTQQGLYFIRVAKRRGLVDLVRNGQPCAYLRVEYFCTHDSSNDYLAVEQSAFELLSVYDRTPLVRLDYLRDPHSVPAAHWNVHAERGAVSNLLGKTNPDHAGLVSKLHLPVGGPRMRPCVEDFIDFAVTEFRFDLRAGARDVIRAGREDWRRKQTGALVRDAPEEAVRVLKKLGYTVAEPGDGPKSPNLERLRGR